MLTYAEVRQVVVLALHVGHDSHVALGGLRLVWDVGFG